MTRIIFGLAGLGILGTTLMSLPSLQSQPPRQSSAQRPSEQRPSEQRPSEQRPSEQRPGLPGPRPGAEDFRPGDGRPGGPPQLEPLGAAIDANRDGELSATEIQAAAKSLLALDRNRNGQLDPDEVPRPEFGPTGPPGGGAGGRGGPNREILKLVEEFDTNGNGYLETAERKSARQRLSERPAGGRGRGPGGRGPGGRGPGGPGGGGPGGGEIQSPGRQVALDEARQYPDADLYDASILRTFFIDFEADNWEEEMAAFYRTDVEIPANLTIDGKAYQNVGIRFRGNSSFFSTSAGQKRSLNVAVDLVNSKQRVQGYKTLNLLNAHTDSSFLRTVLFDRIARDFIPAPKANLVRVVINGESWGIFINEQQVNSEFTDEWFGERSGDRWKVPPDFSGGGALSYKGDRLADYKNSYEIKSRDTEDAWLALVDICRTLKNIPDEKIETDLNAKLNIDGALWFLALDNIFGDGDGYFSRGSDYYVYRDSRHHRFHLLPHDSNETFRLGGGGEFGRGPGGRGPGGRGQGGRGQGGPPGFPPASNAPGFGDAAVPRPGGLPGRENDSGGQSPVLHEHESRLPVISRLLAIPSLRARYLAHVRTIATEWLDWEKLGPVFKAHHQLIFEEIREDTRRLYSFDDFSEAMNAESQGRGPSAKSIGFKRFADARRDFLLSHPEINRPVPVITSVTREESVQAGEPMEITIHTHGGEAGIGQVLLYFSTGQQAPFSVRPAESDGDGVYRALIPAQRGGKTVRYYVEVRSDADTGTTVFSPNRATAGPASVSIPPEFSDTSSVIINEVLSANTRTVADPQGDFDDYIELHNTSDAPINLSGRYLTDSKSRLRKWAFPEGTIIAGGGYLLIWADEDGKSPDGHHASFKLSRKGETVFLVDSDRNENLVLDSLEFPVQRADVAYGRGATGQLEPLTPTPGKQNTTR